MKYNFVVDALVLISSDGNLEKKDLELISEICDMFALSKDDVGFYSNMALGVVEQNSEKFIEFSDENLTVEKVERFKYYYKEFFSGILINNSDILYYYEMKISDIENEKLQIDKKFIIFEKCIFSENNENLRFENCHNVKITESIFTGNKINFEYCTQIYIVNCSFKNCKNGIFNLLECQEFIIKNCILNNCGRSDHGDAYGGIITANSINNITIDDCKFQKCFIRTNHRAYNYYARGAILFMQNNINNIVIENNQFDFCKCDSAASEKQSLFYGNCNNERYENNIITNVEMNLKF